MTEQSVTQVFCIGTIGSSHLASCNRFDAMRNEMRQQFKKTCAYNNVNSQLDATIIIFSILSFSPCSICNMFTFG